MEPGKRQSSEPPLAHPCVRLDLRAAAWDVARGNEQSSKLCQGEAAKRGPGDVQLSLAFLPGWRQALPSGENASSQLRPWREPDQGATPRKEHLAEPCWIPRCST